VNEEALRELATRVGDGALEPMFHALIESESRTVRRKVFDVLADGGPHAWEMAAARLPDPRWQVTRNMLDLLHKADPIPPGVPIADMLGHEEVRVRRAAFPLAMATPALRDRALARALTDEDERLVRMALLEMEAGVPETLVPTIANRVLQAEALMDLRALAVKVLGTSRSALALEKLLGLCTAGRTITRKPKLQARTPEMLAALSVMQAQWPDEPRVRAVLKRGVQSKDPKIRAAASGGRIA